MGGTTYFFPTEFFIPMQCLYHTKDIYVKDIFESTVDGSENESSLTTQQNFVQNEELSPLFNEFSVLSLYFFLFLCCS